MEHFETLRLFMKSYKKIKNFWVEIFDEMLQEFVHALISIQWHSKGGGGGSILRE